MIALLWTVLLLFSLVKTKIVHYSSLAYFPITYLASYSAYNILSGKFRFRLWQKVLCLVIGGILSLVIVLLPVFDLNKDLLIAKGYITDPFIIGNLQAETGWTFLHSCIGIFLIAGLIISLIWFQRKKVAGIAGLYAFTLLFTLLSMMFLTKGAERISQNAAIVFIKEKAGEDVYIKTFYKSYAVLFYGQQTEPDNRNAFDTKWLASGPVDKDAYFISRINNKEEILEKYPELRSLYEKNGYAFFVRKKKI